MASNAKSLWSGIKLGSRATVLAIFLLTPFVYYELRGGRWGIAIGVLAALVPLIFTLVYTCFYREADENSVARVATNFLAGSAFTVVYICLHYGSWQTAFLQLITWFVVGIIIGIMWDPYWAHGPERTPVELWRMTVGSFRAILNKDAGEGQRLESTVEWLLVVYAMWALLQSVRKSVSLGPAGVAIGPAMILGLYSGFLLSYLLRHIWEDWLKLWRQLAAYFWPMAAFVVGYLTIIYVFAGLFAMLWRYNPAHLAPFTHTEFHFDDFLYYSISTVSSLGYSEIRPASLVAKILTSAEFIVGLFWITAVIGILVSQTQGGQLPEKKEVRGRGAGFD